MAMANHILLKLITKSEHRRPLAHVKHRFMELLSEIDIIYLKSLRIIYAVEYLFDMETFILYPPKFKLIIIISLFSLHYWRNKM